MQNTNIAPTKSNLLSLKERLEIAEEGYDLLEQKREILVMSLMQMLDKVKALEKEINSQIEKAYPSLRRMFVVVGQKQAERLAATISYNFNATSEEKIIAGMKFKTISVDMPKKRLPYSYFNSFAYCDQVIIDFFELLTLLTQMASIRTIVWKLAREVKKNQRRVNSLEKEIIPQTKRDKNYVESVLEERDRENIFVLKALKNHIKKDKL
ncbi:MAG: V-type ATP synthase subunit D [Treponema sp.]